MSVQYYLKKITPPVIFDIFRSFRNPEPEQILWQGDYNSWNEASTKSKNYDDNIILEKVKSALLKVKNGEAVYERDSVLFDKIQYSWPLITFLMKVALENEGKLNVMDFGGSLGSSYFQNKSLLNLGNGLKWNVIEQKHFVDCGKMYFEDESLKFYYEIESCLLENNPDILVLSGVLQYLENPYYWISVFNQLKFKYIIVDRTAFIASEKEIIKIQNVSETVYDSDIPAWFFNKDKFIKAFDKYDLVCEFQDETASSIYIKSKYCYWAGFVFSGSQTNI
jgi:putative methyltransferase (TIGR04325 family)